MRRLFVIALSLAGCVQTVDPCAGIAGTCLAVHVEGAGGIGRIDELLVRARGGAVDAQRSTRSAGGRVVALPAAVALLFPAATPSTTLDLQVTAELDGKVTGGGLAAARLVAGGHSSAHVTISPRTIPDGGSLGVTIAAPVDGTASAGSVTVEVDTEPGEVDLVELAIDGVTRATWPGVAPFRFAWDTTVETEGAHQLMARAQSGGVSVASDIRTVYVDRTPPAVTARSPAPGNTAVDTLQPLVVTFSEPIAPTSLAGVTASAGKTPISLSPALSADGRRLSLALGALPPLPATFTVSLASLTDLAGNPLAPTSQWTLTAPAWIALGPDFPGVVTAFEIAAAPHGDLFAAYGVDDNGAVHLHVQHWDGAAWHELGAGFTPAGVVDLEGFAVGDTPLVLYRFSANGDNSYVHQVMRWDAPAWSALGPPITSGGDVQSAIAADAQGNIVAVYPAVDGAGTSLFAVRWDGQRWASLGLPLRHATSGVVDWPSVALDPQGDAVVVFRETANNAVKEYVEMFRQGEEVPLLNGALIGLNAYPGGGTPVTVPALAGEHADHPLVAFTQQDPGGDSAVGLFVYRWDTASWPALASGAPSDVGSACAVAVDTFDRPLALYHDRTIRPGAYVIRWDPVALRWIPLGDEPVAVGLQDMLISDTNGRAVVAAAATGRVLRANQ